MKRLFSPKKDACLILVNEAHPRVIVDLVKECIIVNVAMKPATPAKADVATFTRMPVGLETTEWYCRREHDHSFRPLTERNELAKKKSLDEWYSSALAFLVME